MRSRHIASVYQIKQAWLVLLLRILLKVFAQSEVTNHAGHYSIGPLGHRVVGYPNLGGHKNCDQVTNINTSTASTDGSDHFLNNADTMRVKYVTEMQNNTESLQKKDIVIFNHHTLSSVNKKERNFLFSIQICLLHTVYISYRIYPEVSRLPY